MNKQDSLRVVLGDTDAINALLNAAQKRTEMTTTYSITDGPIVDGQRTGERIRITRVIVRSTDTGYVDVDVYGVSVTKTGKDKSQKDYFYVSYELSEKFREALLKG